MCYVQIRIPDEPSPSMIRQSKTTTMVLDTLLQVVAFDMFLPLFTAAELSRMLRVSRRFNHTIGVYRRNLHDIDKLLLMFFTLLEIRLFRNLQAHDRFLISGSIALQYFAGVVWPDSDLDIYCYPRKFARLARLLRRIGYEYTGRPGSSADLSIAIQNIRDGTQTFHVYGQTHAVMAVLTFKRMVGGCLKKVQLIICKNSPMEAILNFHSTVVMNFIAPTHAVCLYPYSTLHLFEAIRLVPTEAAATAFKKYAERGWDLLGCSSALCGLRRANEIASSRAVGDRATWIIALRGIGVPQDPQALYLKWLFAHSWSHVKGAVRGVVRVVAHVGGRCTWDWPLTFATVCQHLRLHGPVAPEECGVCRQERINAEDLYELVHKSVESCPGVGETEVDRIAADFLYTCFSNMPFFGPIDREILPDAVVAMTAFTQIKAVLYYLRSESRITVAFHLGQQPFVITNLHIFVNASLGTMSKTVALIKSSSTRRPKAASGLSFKLVFTNGRTVSLSTDFIMPKPDLYSSASGANDRATAEDIQTIHAFVKETVLRVPRRFVAIGEIVPVAEAIRELTNCLEGLFNLLRFQPRLTARYSSAVGRTDIHAFTEITVRVPEDWPDLDSTALALHHSWGVVDRLYRLGFAIALTKGGKLFM
ncbi:hypothetical protein V5O48_009132 [Marasmius crinis-equi]|uniref:F-box domain-containing protein n=1 Tax=Marasmius crinis-equi TaxID=585013 RepID=A0ABR3FCH7_9AGAR